MAEAAKDEPKKEEAKQEDKGNDKKLIIISGITSGIGAVLYNLFCLCFCNDVPIKYVKNMNHRACFENSPKWVILLLDLEEEKKISKN